MVLSLLSFRRPARAAQQVEAEVPVVVEPTVESAVNLSSGFEQMLDLFERDVSRIVTGVVADINLSKDCAIKARNDLGVTEAAIGTLVEAAARADAEIQGIATSSEEMQSAATEILSTVSDVRERSAVTAQSATRSAEEVHQLVQSIHEIGALLNAIDEIASRTNLLALNATIEAARAGEAGRGFAVVAQEVKALSVAAGQSVSTIRQRMQSLQEAGTRAMHGMKQICADVGELAPVAETIAQAADEQRATIVDLAQRMHDAREAVGSMRKAVHEIDDCTREAKRASDRVAGLSQTLAVESAGLTRRVSVLLRGAGIANRRAHERFPIDLAMRIQSIGEPIAARSFDISEGGVLIRCDAKVNLKVGTRTDVDISRIGVAKVEVRSVSPMGTHCAFVDLSSAVAARLKAVIAEFEAEHAPLIQRAIGLAAEIQDTIKADISSGKLDIDDLFDTDYRLIEDSDPRQFTTRYLGRFDAILPPILERVLRSDSKLAFCIAADRNGYVPVHNQQVSHPQRKGDTAWNTANCRNRRIFDDRTGLLAGRNTRPYLIQTYNRDMGNGVMVQMKEINAPITVDGQHWGGVRTAYKL